ncbi:hypothetical protein BhaS171_00063 [Bacillus phage vB_BhaS-171]|uniref:Holliday junction resolvase n=1 Tax=Bacillus phage vB_BhaS-171 TaxID=1775140 RepID=UPI000744B48E|nr:Holliday junction resolvase [Bacillus phage vB_BhaS-171]ALY08119.1 hypothetical protein BhaS171_00063 [Bacillus phage vB_BhaS-171]
MKKQVSTGSFNYVQDDKNRAYLTLRRTDRLFIRVFTKLERSRAAAVVLETDEEPMTKYNAKKTEICGIQFDSKAESQYYLLLMNKLAKGEIQDFNLQPVFTLQEGFKKDGKSYRPVLYKADFEVIHLDGSIEIVDVKGMITPVFALKRKMFEKKFSYNLKLIKYVKKFGGWVTLDEYERLKKEEEKRG